MHPEPYFTKGRVTLRRAQARDARAIADFYLRNTDHLSATSPRRPPDFVSEAFWSERIAKAELEFAEDRACTLYLFEAERALGMVNLMHFARGALQGCELGYAIDAAHEGAGLMHWAVGQALRYAFSVLNLHRVQANHLPDNERSARLLARLGFRHEGTVEKFLLIDGAWRDHIRTSLLNAAWRPKPGDEYVLSETGAQPA